MQKMGNTFNECFGIVENYFSLEMMWDGEQTSHLYVGTTLRTGAPKGNPGE